MTLPVNQIICGDCLTVMKDWPDKSIDIVLTDPPYFIPAEHYQTRSRFKRSVSDLGVLEGFFHQFFEQIDRVLKNDGLLYVFCDGQSYPLFYYQTFLICKTVRPIIWDKITSVNGYYWRHQHELILFGVRPEKHKIPTGLGDVLKFRAVPVGQRRHPAEKPKDLLKCILQNTARNNEIIVDPFAGSCSVLEVARELGLPYIGIELSEEYIKDSNTEVPVQEQFKGQTGLFESSVSSVVN
ncbi:MAG: site-specific DNA-methyltransferase [Phycisphaerae bacterium]|nr:site-specific DNA-methyltransferase [Phycisphaerae bacterium]